MKRLGLSNGAEGMARQYSGCEGSIITARPLVLDFARILNHAVGFSCSRAPTHNRSAHLNDHDKGSAWKPWPRSARLQRLPYRHPSGHFEILSKSGNAPYGEYGFDPYSRMKSQRAVEQDLESTLAVFVFLSSSERRHHHSSVVFPDPEFDNADAVRISLVFGSKFNPATSRAFSTSCWPRM